MHIEEVKKLDPMERLVYWIREREIIRLRKESSRPTPWTDDEILSRYRFCNVRRMDDRVSKWLLEHWYMPHQDSEGSLVAVSLARFINLPASLEKVGYPWPWNPERVKNVLRGIRDGGSTVFNAAYIVRGNDGIDKIESVVDYYVNPLHRLSPTINTDSMEKTWANLYERYGMGSFMAGQIVADLRWALTGKWKDKRTWAPKGPGSQRGMNRLLGRDLAAPISQAEFADKLRWLMDKCDAGKSIASRLEAIDWQNCLCEYDKYVRTLQGEGRPKRKYP
jgi:hypothetical protein